MNEIGEALGGAVEGGLLARAVEPATGGDGHTHEGACLNCGTPLVGPHCHSCGQRAHVHRTLGAFFHDLLHGVLHFEGKTWRTLPMLAWKPGRLTREYIEGKRAKYISPIALFLFVVFVSFALWSALGGIGDVGSLSSNVDPASTAQMRASIDDMDEDIARLEKRLAEVKANESAAAALPGIESELESKRKARRLTADLLGTVSGTPIESGAGEADETTVQVGSGSTAAERNVATLIGEAWKKAKANPGLLLYKLQTNAYKLSWLLIPLSLPFMWLLFPFNRKFRMYDHTVFVTYSIAFMTMLVALASLAAYVGLSWLVMAAMLYAPVHLYWQLRGAYGLSRAGAFARLAVLSVFIWIVLGLFGLVMIGLVL